MYFERLLQQRADVFCLKGLRRPANVTMLSRVMDADSFARFHVKWEDLGYETDEDDGRRVCEGLKRGTITPAHYKGELRTKRPFFWCTPWEDIASVELAADTVRNRLGLQYIPGGVYLLRIDVPNTKLNGRYYAAPTALDGGCNEVYSSCAATDGFGRTLDLERYDDGVRELVVEAILLDQEFTVKPIGRTDRTPTNLDSFKLYQRCRQRRTCCEP